MTERNTQEPARTHRFTVSRRLHSITSRRNIEASESLWSESAGTSLIEDLKAWVDNEGNRIESRDSQITTYSTAIDEAQSPSELLDLARKAKGRFIPPEAFVGTFGRKVKPTAHRMGLPPEVAGKYIAKRTPIIAQAMSVRSQERIDSLVQIAIEAAS